MGAYFASAIMSNNYLSDCETRQSVIAVHAARALGPHWVLYGETSIIVQYHSYISSAYAYFTRENSCLNISYI